LFNPSPAEQRIEVVAVAPSGGSGVALFDVWERVVAGMTLATGSIVMTVAANSTALLRVAQPSAQPSI